MTWYAAHVLMLVEFQDGNQDRFPAWENVYLVDARDEEEAKVKATQAGKEQEGDAGGSFYWGERPAQWKMVAVRKVVAVSNSNSIDNQPGDGAELTYQTLEFSSRATLLSYAAQELTVVTVVD